MEYIYICTVLYIYICNIYITALPPPADDAGATILRTGSIAAAEQRARSLFEAALRPSTCGACAALWRAYMALELRANR